MDGPAHVFVSYSHDSDEHKQRVLDLAHRLRIDGIDCHIDRYVPFPPEGWPAWMERQIRSADFVLVVATEPYHLRVTGQELTGVGAGAKWEGAIITAELYRREGRNEKFIPVVFSPSDITYIPSFLSQFTRFDLSRSDGYEDLYRLLTRQPHIVPPPLGSIRQLTNAARQFDEPNVGSSSRRAQSSQPLVLIASRRQGIKFIPAEDIRAAQALEMDLRPRSAVDVAFLTTLREQRGEVGIAYNLSAALAAIEEVEHRVSRDGEIFHLRATLRDKGYATFMEVGTTGYSADDIAELRARRILLNDKLPKGDRTMLEALVSGVNTYLEVDGSPIPDLYRETGHDPTFFIVAARLACVLWLRLSGTVEFVLRLDLTQRGREVGVEFEGQRARKYSNAEPVRLAFSGTLELPPLQPS